MIWASPMIPNTTNLAFLSSEPKSEIEIVQVCVFAKAGHTAWNFFTKKKKFKRWTFVVAIG